MKILTQNIAALNAYAVAFRALVNVGKTGPVVSDVVWRFRQDF